MSAVAAVGRRYLPRGWTDFGRQLMIWFGFLLRHESFKRFRTWILLANVLGLVGYVLLPTAPPRMFQSLGFIDTLGSMSSMNHGSGLVEVAPNPYAAMPSLHAADALIVAIMLITVTRRRWLRLVWALWPLWVWFCVMATANHFWLDVVAGVAVALLAFALLQSRRFLRLVPKLA